MRYHGSQQWLQIFGRFIVDIKLSYPFRGATKEDGIVSTINEINKRNGVTIVSRIDEIFVEECKFNESQDASQSSGAAMLIKAIELSKGL